MVRFNGTQMANALSNNLNAYMMGIVQIVGCILSCLLSCLIDHLLLRVSPFDQSAVAVVQN